MITVEFFKNNTSAGKVTAVGSQVEFVGVPDNVRLMLNAGIVVQKKKLYPHDGEDFVRGLLDAFRSPYLRAVLVS